MLKKRESLEREGKARKGEGGQSRERGGKTRKEYHTIIPVGISAPHNYAAHSYSPHDWHHCSTCKSQSFDRFVYPLPDPLGPYTQNPQDDIRHLSVHKLEKSDLFQILLFRLLTGSVVDLKLN